MRAMNWISSSINCLRAACLGLVLLACRTGLPEQIPASPADGHPLPDQPPRFALRSSLNDRIDRALDDIDALIAAGQDAQAINRIADSLQRRTNRLTPAGAAWVRKKHAKRGPNDAYVANAVYEPSGRAAAQRLKTLPARMIAAYRAAATPKADRALSIALGRADAVALAELARQYPLTDAEARALYALGAVAHQRREYRRAARYWEQLLSTSGAPEIDRRAVAFRIAEARASAGDALPPLPPEILSSVSIDGGRRAPMDYLRSVAARHTLTPLTAAPATADWSVRNLEAMAPMSIASLFHPIAPPVETVASNREIRFYDVEPVALPSGEIIISTEYGTARFDDARLSVAQQLRPAAILMRQRTEALFAHPAPPLAIDESTLLLPVQPLPTGSSTSRRLPTGASASNSIYFALAQIGLRGYATERTQEYRPSPVQRADGSESLRHGIASGPAALGDGLAGLITASQFGVDDWRWHFQAIVPAPDGGTATLAFSTDICDGMPALAAGQNGHLPMLALPPRVSIRPDGSVDSFVIPNQGCAARIDGLTGELIWLSAYEAAERDKGENLYPMPYPTAPVIYGDMLIAMPQDTPYLFGFDCETGRLRWAYSRQPQILRFLLTPPEGATEIILPANRWSPSTRAPAYCVAPSTSRRAPSGPASSATDSSIYRPPKLCSLTGMTI